MILEVATFQCLDPSITIEGACGLTSFYRPLGPRGELVQGLSNVGDAVSMACAWPRSGDHSYQTRECPLHSFRECIMNWLVLCSRTGYIDL